MEEAISAKRRASKTGSRFKNTGKNLNQIIDKVLYLTWYVGSVSLDLADLPLPFSSSDKIRDHHALVNRERQSLFEQRRVYGWWPVTGRVKTKSKSKKKEKKTQLTVSARVPYLFH